MEEDDIAAAMGFSSFGGTKRKFDQTNSPKMKPGGSGANSTELGVRTKRSPQKEHEDDHSQPITTETEYTPNDAFDPNITPSFKGKQKQKQAASSGLAGFLTRGQSLPERPPVPGAQLPDVQLPDIQRPDVRHVQPDDPEPVSFGGPTITKGELHALRHGVLSEHGDFTYFLPSFVEDPWERIKSQQR
ncbi:hypothetical protein B0J11DRAFT_75124 [Dendryphion nanum]|uniref:Uncharacterized protein n=1 Tax=Dendryphion nanum TaxID=256645 RepID=A0A9P9DGK3_9PLEO|nr:hypothetical protein B0J11DRAFT_75124 [Dendryphion nanum]